MLVKELTDYPDTPKKFLHVTAGPDAIVDSDLFNFLSGFSWRWKKSFHSAYIVTSWRYNCKTITVQMHRIVAQTPPHMLTHHINRNTRDNRRANLRNMLDFDHVKYHSWR